jgi:phosphoglycolate phosphatase
MINVAKMIKNEDYSWLEAVVFDLDGTLLDSAPDLTAALNLVLEMDGLEPLGVDSVRYMIGAGVPKLIERGFREHGVKLDAASLDPELLDAFLSYYNAHAADLSKVYPGTYGLIEMLCDRSVRIGLCTNKPTEATREILASFQIEDCFDSVVGGTSGFPKKPDPAGLNACLEEMGVSALQTLYIGDSATDIKTARNGGLPVVAMSYGYERTPAHELGADLVVDSFGELKDVLVKTVKIRPEVKA